MHSSRMFQPSPVNICSKVTLNIASWFLSNAYSTTKSIESAGGHNDNPLASMLAILSLLLAAAFASAALGLRILEIPVSLACG